MDKINISGELKSLNNIIMRMVENNAHIFLDKDVSGVNMFIIGYLVHNKTKVLYQKDIEKTFNITRSTASRILSLMESKGLIVRTAVDGDARLKRVEASDQAIAYGKQIKKQMEKNEDIMLNGFCMEEKQKLLEYIHRMKDNVKKYTIDIDLKGVNDEE